MSHATDPLSHDVGYRHEALFYANADEFMAGTLPFLRDAVAAGEPTLVVLADPKIQALRAALNGEAEQLLCPYDTTALATAVIDEARRNHPFVSARGVPEFSASFPGVEALAAPFDEPLPDPPGDAALMYIEQATPRGVREFIACTPHARGSILTASKIWSSRSTSSPRTPCATAAAKGP